MTTLYLGTDDGVILTHNGQTGFAQAGHGLGGRRVRSLAGFPGRPDVAYAGVEGEGLYLTEDAGESWELLVEGDVHSLAIRHAAPGLLQGQEPVIYTGLAPPAVLVSTDRGRSWRECLLEVSRPAEEEGSEPAVRCLALHPQLSPRSSGQG